MSTETERLKARIDALEKMLAELERALMQGQHYKHLAKSNKGLPLCGATPSPPHMSRP
jgi:hypothetical protein